MTPLTHVLAEFKKGVFTGVDQLTSLLSSKSRDVRLYALQLFADVCSNEAVPLIENALDAAATVGEIRGGLLRLGETLSLRAIPILLDWSCELNDTETDEYVCQALQTILPVQGVDETNFSPREAEKLYSEATRRLNDSLYYYYGKPVFMGDITKEVIQACTVAYHKRNGCILTVEPQILSNFSGIPLPVSGGQQITDADMKELFSYVKLIAGMEWKVGAKYFFRHEIVP